LRILFFLHNIVGIFRTALPVAFYYCLSNIREENGSVIKKINEIGIQPQKFCGYAAIFFGREYFLN